eukprot:7977548-Alexandrium_andersonii.AAC.1
MRIEEVLPADPQRLVGAEVPVEHQQHAEGHERGLDRSEPRHDSATHSPREGVAAHRRTQPAPSPHRPQSVRQISWLVFREE